MAATVAHEVFLVPQQFLTIQAAIDAVRGRATIVVAPAVYAESLRIRDKQDIVIQSALLTRRGVTISGDGGLAVLCVERSNLHLSGVEIRSNACNRGLWVMNSSLSLQDSIVAGNRIGEGADQLFGAGMYCQNSTVRIQKTAIVGNVVNGGTAAKGAGGGGLFFQNCQVELAGGTVQANEVYAGDSARGGGIWCERSKLRMWRSRVTDNTLRAAWCTGAGIYFYAPIGVQLGGSVIVGNGSPCGRGGGIFVEGGDDLVSVHRNTVVRQNHPTDVEFG